MYKYKYYQFLVLETENKLWLRNIVKHFKHWKCEEEVVDF